MSNDENDDIIENHKDKKLNIKETIEYFCKLDIPLNELEKQISDEVTKELYKYSLSKLSLAYRILTKQTSPQMSDSDTAKRIMYNYHKYKFPHIKLPFERKLDIKQQKIVTFAIDKKKNIIINAGPGTGKTTMLIELTYKLVNASKKVLYISYENKAINEPKNRILIYPRVNHGIKKWKTKKSGSYDLVFSTIDSLACNIANVYEDISNNDTLDYDQYIRKSIELLKLDDENRKKIVNQIEKLTKKIDKITIDINLINTKKDKFEEKQNTKKLTKKEQKDFDELLNKLSKLEEGATKTKSDLRTLQSKIKEGFNFQYIKLMDYIIVDEAQDIDDLRMELLFVLANKYNIKLIICGDPKQRLNSNSGDWFKKMWIGEKPSFMDNTLFEKFVKRHLNKTYRFKNSFLVDMINSLSLNTRPKLHVNLIRMNTKIDYTNDMSCVKNIPCYLTNNDNEIHQMSCLAEHLQTLNENGINWSDMLVCSISKDGDNETSKYIQKFYSICNNKNIPCYNNCDDDITNYSKNGIRFSTSRSTKGSEADIVIVCGVSAQNKCFKMTEDEAYSLNFVVCSRARKQLIFLAKEYYYTQPVGLDEKLLYYHNSKPSQICSAEILEPINKFSVTDIVKDRGFETFFRINKLNETYKIKEDKIDNYKKVIKPENISNDLWGIIMHTCVQICLSNQLPLIFLNFTKKNYKSISDVTFKYLKNNGLIINGHATNDIKYNDCECKKDTILISNNNINAPSMDEIKRMNNIKEKFDKSGKKILTNNDLKDIVQIITWIQSNHMRSRYDISFGKYSTKIIDICDEIAQKIIKKFGKCKQVEDDINFGDLIGKIDSVHSKNTIIEFKTSDNVKFSIEYIHQLLLYGISYSKNQSFNPNPKMILMNLTNGTINEIQILLPYRLKYCCDRFMKLHKHITFVKMNCDNKLDLNLQKGNYYIVDTEYSKFSHEIFEITLLNLQDPYKTIVGLIDTEYYNSEGIHWLNERDKTFRITEDYFDKKNVITFEEICKIIKKDANVYNHQNTVLLYYHSPVDIEWIKDIDELNISSINLAKSSRVLAENNGSFILPIPKATDIYNSFCINPFFINQYLNPHISLSDVLMFYELFYIGYNLIEMDIELIMKNKKTKENLKHNIDIDDIDEDDRMSIISEEPSMNLILTKNIFNLHKNRIIDSESDDEKIERIIEEIRNESNTQIQKVNKKYKVIKQIKEAK